MQISHFQKNIEGPETPNEKLPTVNARPYQFKLALKEIRRLLKLGRQATSNAVLKYGQIVFDNYFKYSAIFAQIVLALTIWLSKKTYQYIIKPGAKFAKALLFAILILARTLTLGAIDGIIDLFVNKKHTTAENLAKITANLGAIIVIGFFITKLVVSASSGVAQFAGGMTLTTSEQDHVKKSLALKKPVVIGNSKSNSAQTTTATRLPNGDIMPTGISYQNATTLTDTYNPNQSIKVVDKLFTGTNLTTQQQFFNKIAPGAQIAAASWGVNPSVMMAQAAIESDFGRSTLASQYQNYFGIKYRGAGKKVNMLTTEYYDGVTPTKIYDNFQVYDNVADSMSGNGQLLRQGITGQANRYAGTWAENTSSYKDATQNGLQDKYATSPDYANTLNKMIELYGLYVLDNHQIHNSDLQK